MEREQETHQCEIIRHSLVYLGKVRLVRLLVASKSRDIHCGIRGNPSVELVAIVDPATVTWSKYNLDMKPTKELAEMYQVLMDSHVNGSYGWCC